MSTPRPATEVSSPGTATGPRRAPEFLRDPDRPPEDVPPFEVLHDGHRVVVLGSVDSFTADRLAGQLPAAPPGPVALLDLSGLEFADVAACRVLARWARAAGSGSECVQVTGASRLFRRMWQLLALDDVAPVSFTATRP